MERSLENLRTIKRKYIICLYIFWVFMTLYSLSAVQDSAAAERETLLYLAQLTQTTPLKEGIELYRQKAYEKAVEVLIRARKEVPTSTTAAFFLGLAYKQVLDYPNAAKQFRDAVTLTPRIKEGLIELIDVLQKLGEKENLEEARKWLEEAKKAKIFPAKIAFLEGLILQKEGRFIEAVQYFETAKSIDPEFTQAAEFQIAISYMNAKDLKKAKERLDAAVSYNPGSDLARFAQRYGDALDKRIDFERPVHITASVIGGYDSNVVLKPGEATIAPNITDEEDYFVNPVFRFDYTPKLKTPWLLSANYTFNGLFYKDHADTHNLVSNSIGGISGYSFGKYSLNLSANYNHILRKNPSYKPYLQVFGLGPVFRMVPRENHLLEVFGGFFSKDFDDPPLIPEEDRDANGANAYLNWIWSLKTGAFITLRYDFAYEDANGDNWDNTAHRFAANASVPFIPQHVKDLRVQVGVQAFLQDFENLNSVFGVEREDDIYQVTAGLRWQFHRYMTLLANYRYTDANSNIAVYDYDRHLITGGVEFRY